METKGSASAFSAYLDRHDKAARMKILASLRAKNEPLPIALAEDLVALDLGIDEKALLLEAVSGKDSRALEQFLTENLFSWPQDLAVLAVRVWDERTDHLLWTKVLDACRSPHLAQRVLYTILDHGFSVGGANLIGVIVGLEGLKELSTAFHGLLLHRATQFGVKNEQLDALAHSVMNGLRSHLHPDNKALASALAYLARFAPADLDGLADQRISEPWRSLIRAVAQGSEMLEKHRDKLTRLVQKPPKTKPWAKVITQWLPLWQRHKLDVETVAGAVKLALSEDVEGNAPNDNGPVLTRSWEIFAGIPPETLLKAIEAQTDDSSFATALARWGGLLPSPADAPLLQLARQRVAASTDPATILAKLPLRLRLEMTDGSMKSTNNNDKASQESEALSPELAARKRFFDIAFRGATPQKINGAGGTFFDLLADAWQSPADQKLGPLAQAARQVEGVFRLCYLHTLGRFKGHDQAALKLLDFIRSKEEDDIRAVIAALSGIGTARAAQELVSTLTRPNVTPALQLEVCASLKRLDVTNLQNELRSAFKDLKVTTSTEDQAEVREAIAGLLIPTSTAESPRKIADASASDQQLDQALTAKIQNYRELSSEVKRALRTSQFFHLQVSGANAPESIDLSPVIDMQYKALELLFREGFEEACSRLIHRGVLQRRLDVIGYARPIPRAMDEFEAYVASLPTIKDIPFFSKFKLRKMLRAICQFRPGKRFTLDGLKAFALFFLCFSRSECRYGLGGIFPIGLRDDTEVFEFCKALHVMQDFRNRAAHEGFHPDASNDIDGIWRATAEIVQTMFKVKAYLDDAAAREYAPKSRSAPIIEKKVS